jgi:hypothetical protein
MFKYLLAGLAACFTVLPSLARVDPGTADLLHLVDSYGVDVRFNTSSCDGSKHGSFGVRNSIPILTLCIDKNNVTAEDHDTVRHEVWHYVQYCATPSTSNVLHPLLKDRTKHAELTRYALSGLAIERIRDNYRDDDERVELEAFAAAELFTADFIGEQVIAYCTPTR